MTTRIVHLCLLAGLVIALPLSHSVVSAKKGKGPPPKIAICHFPDGSAVGHVIEVSESAVAAHVSKHGDCTAFVKRETGTACRCQTCEEACLATAQQCAAECDPNDPNCVPGCRRAYNACIAECPDGEPE